MFREDRKGKSKIAIWSDGSPIRAQNGLKLYSEKAPYFLGLITEYKTNVDKGRFVIKCLGGNCYVVCRTAKLIK